MMRKLVLFVVLAFAQFALAAPGDLIFYHDFENNSLDPASGVVIGSGDRSGGPPTVSTANAHGGTHSAALVAGGGAPSLGYLLTQDYASITVQFYLYIPSNYKAAKIFPGVEGWNNKVFRAYSSIGYNSSEKIGFSTEEDSSPVSPDPNFEECVPEWGAPGGNLGAIGPQGTGSQNFILSGDQGSWVKYKIYVSNPKASGSGNRGTMKLWKNDVLIIDATGIVNNYDPADNHMIREFYLLGAANTHFSPTVTFYIDDISVWDGEPGASPPAAPAFSRKTLSSLGAQTGKRNPQ